MYGKWVVHGGKGTVEGTLPVVEGSGEAWWHITTDGMLGIVGDGTVTKLFAYDNNDASKYSSEYWGNYRNEVSSLAMQPGFETLDMECWFALMPKIVDTGSAFVPATCETVNSLFFGSTKLKEVSNDLYISGPSTSVKIASSMFNGCASLERLSDRFTIPSGVEDCRWMFANCTNLKELPASFAIADSATLLTSMFRGCRHLVSLPEDFRIPSANGADVSIASMFQDCNALAALPEGFLIPNLVAEGGTPGEGLMDNLFAGCESLTRFPDSFDFPVDLAISSTSPFQCANMTNTYYNGSGAGVAAYADRWAGQNRTIVRSVPSGSFTASFFLPDETTGEYGPIPWTKTFTDGSGILAELSGPVRAGQKFLGWYSLADSKKPFDFTKALTEDVDLYGRYAATSGPLPVVGAEDNADPNVAGWKLDSDGALSVWCAPGKTIARLWKNDRTKSDTTYWGPVRGQVKSVKMREGLLALDVDSWFRDMPQLVDASETFVPEGADSTTYMFASATALPTLANSRLTMPDSVKLAGNMFCDCWALESIPSGFGLSKNLEVATGMFGRCKALRSLPSSFAIPEEGPSLKLDLVFLECSSLEMLPAGFTIPARVTTCRSLFSKCSSLSTLPEGFCFEGEYPEVAEVHDLFNGCVSLTSLPASLDLAKLVGVDGFNGNLFGGLPSGQQLVTYYPGDLSRLYPGEAGRTADEVKAYWRDKYRRVLVGPGDPLPDAGMRKVEFRTRLVSDGGALSEWDAYTATVTDATGSFKAPAAPSRYGYLFDGWYKDPDCTTKFAFDADGSATVSADTVLYGKLTLKVAVEVPTRATVMIDATGTMQPAAVQMKSFSPVELAVEKVTCTSLASASQVVDASALASAKVVLTNATDDETVVKLDASRPTPANNLVVPAASTARPGVLEYTVGLKGLSGSDYRFFGDGWVTDVARLSYVVGPSAI